MKTNEMGLMALVLFAACFPPLHIKGELEPMPDDTGIVTDDSGETGNPCEEIDADGDGFSACDDCDDGNSEINPDAIEECTDLVDIDCDGFITGVDDDEDGVAECEDCDDADSSAYPGNTEVCDGIDNDCNGDTDGDAVDKQTWYADTDGDGYGDPATTVSACSTPTGYVAHDGDCDDTDALVNPGAMEDCSATDDMNCDGLVGADDNDGDGYGACEECNDTDALVNPGATEVCGDGTDNDCNGVTDTDAADFVNVYVDNDGDGYGDESDPGTPMCEGIGIEGYVEDNTDCDDGVAAVNPGELEVCADTVDNDCDGTADEADCEAGDTGDTGTPDPWIELPLCTSTISVGGGGYIAVENRSSSFATVQYGCGSLTDGVGVAAGSRIVENPASCTGYVACADANDVWAYAY